MLTSHSGVPPCFWPVSSKFSAWSTLETAGCSCCCPQLSCMFLVGQVINNVIFSANHTNKSVLIEIHRFTDNYLRQLQVHVECLCASVCFRARTRARVCMYRVAIAFSPVSANHNTDVSAYYSNA